MTTRKTKTVNEESVRKMLLDEFRAQLTKNENERGALVSLIKGLESWQRRGSTES